MSALDVQFHLNVGDKTAYVCRLLRKAYRQGARVQVLLPHESAQALDTALWLLTPADFIPHARSNDPAHVRQRSPILLSEALTPDFDAEVVINLLSDSAPELERLAGSEKATRLIEVVGNDAADKQQARARWKHYKTMGIEPQAHDLAKV